MKIKLKYVKLYANDDEKKIDIEKNNSNEVEKEHKLSGEFLHKKSSRLHSTSIDIDYDFYEDEIDCEDENDNKSGISSNSSLEEELVFGKGKK